MITNSKYTRTLRNAIGQPKETNYLYQLCGMLATSLRNGNYRVVLALLDLMRRVSLRNVGVN